jgi:hypothetical protein
VEQQQEQQPKSKPRQKLLNEMENRRSQSGSRAALSKENKELTTNLQQLSHSSQDSGYQQSE